MSVHRKPLLIVVYATATIQLLTSPATPHALLSALQSLALDYPESAVELKAVSREKELVDMELSLVFDYTFNETLSIALESVVQRYFPMWPTAHQAFLDYSDAFYAYLQAFALHSIYLITDSQPHNLAQSHYLLSHFPTTFPQSSTLTSPQSLDDCLWFLSRFIKPRGVLAIAFLVDPVTAFNCITALDLLKLNRPGYVYFLSQEASEYRYGEGEETSLHRGGLVLVAGKEAEASTRAEYERNRIQSRLNSLQSDDFQPTKQHFSLYFIREKRPILFSSTPLSPLTLSNVLLPGNSTELMRLSKPSILASVDYQMTSSDGTTSPVSLVVMRGFQVAFEEVNQRSDLLPDYWMLNSSVDFTGIINNVEVTKQRIQSEMGKLGLIHMSPPFSQAVVTTFQALHALNLSVPITGSTFGAELSDIQAYPLYVRTRAGFSYLAVMICQVFTYLKWSKIAVLYQKDGGESEGSYHIFKDLVGEYGINITNDEGKRSTPAYITANTTSAVQPSIQAIMDSDTRIVLILSSVYYSILDIMYDMGAREGYEVIVAQGISRLYFNGKSFVKRRIVNSGGLSFFPSIFVGQIGESVRQRLIAKDGDNYLTNTCLYYDAAMLYFHATDYLLESGQDYEDPYSIIKAMRTTRFQGCSGLVKISPGSNDREPGEVQISNFQYHMDTDSYEIKLVGTYNPFISQPYKQLTTQIQWPNGEATFSDTKPKYRECKYLQEEVRLVAIGEIVGCGVVGLTVCIVGILVVVARKGVLKGQWTPAIVAHTTTSYDLMSYALGVMDFFIFASLGPGVDRMRETVNLEGSAILIYDKILEAYGAAYWLRLNFSLAFALVWLSLIVFKSTRFSAVRGLTVISNFTTAVSPCFINLAYMPIVSGLLQVYMCTQGLGSQLTETILDADCGTICWSGHHLAYAIASAIVLISFSFAGLVYRIRMENLHDIQVNPKSVLIKLPTLLLLSGLQVTLRENHPDIHAYTYLSVMVVFTLLINVYEEFNYPRFCMWTWLIYIAVILFAIVAFLQSKMSTGAGRIAVAVLGGVYCLLLVVGCLIGRFVPKYKAQILGERGKDVRPLFEFAFSLGTRAKKALALHYSINHPRQGTEQQFSLYV